MVVETYLQIARLTEEGWESRTPSLFAAIAERLNFLIGQFQGRAQDIGPIRTLTERTALLARVLQGDVALSNKAELDLALACIVADLFSTAGRVCYAAGLREEALRLVRKALQFRLNDADQAICAEVLTEEAQKQLAEAALWSLQGDFNHKLTPEQAARTTALIDALDLVVTLPQRADNRTNMWATIRGLDAWLTYARVRDCHPRKTETPHNPMATREISALTAPQGRPLYDCFTFFNELDVLEIRLAELYQVVDHFVLVEATFSHTGGTKPLYFAENRRRFEAYADKIIHVVVEDDPGGFAWKREAHQREAIARGLVDCPDEAMIMVSDADEILRAAVAGRLRCPDADFDQFFAPELALFFYFFNLMAPEPWESVAAAPYRLVRQIGPNRMRYLAKQGVGHRLPGAGWHFTWAGGAERYLTKLHAFAHEEGIAVFQQNAATHAERVQRFFTDGDLAQAIPGMRTDLRRMTVDQSYPLAVQAKKDHYRKLGWLLPDPDPSP